MKSFLTILGVGLAALTVTAQPLQRDPQLRIGQLKNGLTYYVYPNPNPKGEAVYRLFVKAGSVQERDDQQGLAHFLEHLAFNGTRHFPGDGIVRFLESKGAKFGKDLNAHTSFTETVYKLQLPCTDPLMVDSTLTILADWAGGLTIAPDEVDKERGVILSEWLSRGGTQTDNSMRLVMELLNGSLYSRRITIGDTAIIRHCPPQTIRDYYEHWYHPALMAVAVVGDVDANQMEQLICEKFSQLPASRKTPNLKQVPIPYYKKEQATVATDKGVTTIELDMLMLLPQPRSVQTADDYRQYLTRSLINRLMKQRFSALSFDDPAYGKASVQYSRFLTAGVTDASVELQKGRLRQGISDFIRHQQQIYRYGFTRTEIARAAKSLLSGMQGRVRSGQKPRSSDVMNELYADYYDGNRFISRHDELALMERHLPQIDSVGLLRQLRKVFETRPMHYLLRGPEEAADEIGGEDSLLQLIRECRRQPVERYYRQIDVPEALCSVEPADHIISEQPIPEIEATDLRLDNGTRVIFRQSDADRGRIVLSGFRKGGQYGVDSLHYYTSLVGPSVISLSGAGDFSRDALNHYLTGNSASMHFLVDRLRTGVAGSARMDDAETMFQLLWLKWTQPRLDTAVCRMTIDKLVEGYRQKQETPTDKFSRELGWLMSGRNYTNAVMTDTVVNTQVNPADMLPLFNRFYGPATGYTFVVIGDCPLDDVRQLISTYIGGLPKGQSDTTWVAPHRQLPQRDTMFVSRTADDQKARVTLTYQQNQAPVDMQTAEVKADMLKSILRSALLKRLREELGKVYSVSVSSGSGRYPTYLSRTSIGFVCQPADVDTLIAATRIELQQFCDHPSDYAAYLDDVKLNLVKEHQLQLQKTAYWTQWMRNNVYNNQEDWSWFARYADVVQAVTPANLADFARWAITDARLVKAVLLPNE